MSMAKCTAKGSVDYMVLFLIGLVIAGIAIVATYPFLLKLVGVVTPKTDEPTINSLNLLEQEILRLGNGESREIPFYVKQGWFLRSNIPNCPSIRLCVCKDADCDGIVSDGVKQIGGFEFSTVNIDGDTYGTGTLKNVKISKQGKIISIVKP